MNDETLFARAVWMILSGVARRRVGRVGERLVKSPAAGPFLALRSAYD